MIVSEAMPYGRRAAGLEIQPASAEGTPTPMISATMISGVPRKKST